MASQTPARIAKRLKIFEPGMIRSGRMTARVHLLDLSHTGALVHGEAPPLPGTIVRIECKGIDVPARIVWTRAQKFGIAFLKPLSKSELQQIIDSRPHLPNSVFCPQANQGAPRAELTARLVTRIAASR